MSILGLLVGILLIIVGFFLFFPLSVICWIAGGIVILLALGVVSGSPTGRRWFW